MCSYSELQHQISDMRTELLAKLDEYHVDSEQRHQETANRLTALEARTADGEAHDKETDAQVERNTEAIQTLSEKLESLPTTIAGAVRSEIQSLRDEEDLTRYREREQQLRRLGWKIVAGVIGSSAVITWLLTVATGG